MAPNLDNPTMMNLLAHPLYQYIQQFQKSIIAELNSGSPSIPRSRYAHDSLKIVALHIPEFRRGKYGEAPRSVPHPTIIGCISSLSLKPIAIEHWNLLSYHLVAGPYGMLPSVHIPDEIESCGPSIITCVDESIEWDPQRLLYTLFHQGLGDARFMVNSHFENFLEDPVCNFHEFCLSESESVGLQLMSLSAQNPSAAQNFAESWNCFYATDLSLLKQVNAASPIQGHGQSPNSSHHSVAPSPLSNFSSPASFMTANSPASFMTARSNYASPALAVINEYSSRANMTTIREDQPPDPSLPAPLQNLHVDYYQGLHSRNICQPFDKELNWSGKGQHVTFKPQENVPFTFLFHLGSSLTAKVDKVLCRRIALARKMMRCTRQWKIADALDEVYHLQNLRHAHIVQLVGTYLQGRNFSILLYPAADYHLGQFFEDTCDIQGSFEYQSRLRFLLSTISCLTSAISFIHEHTTKHMDIKPQNILVRDLFPNSYRHGWGLYLADFGLSRSFASQDHSQTDGPTARTPRYCAPEVFRLEQRGRSADIFSLGCVYLEILTVYNELDLQDFADARKGDGEDESFHGNLTRVSDWFDDKLDNPAHYNVLFWSKGLTWPTFKTICGVVKTMVHEDANQRPTASSIVKDLSEKLDLLFFRPGVCCSSGPEPYEEYVPPPGLGLRGPPTR